MSKVKKLEQMESKVRKNKKLGVQNMLPEALSLVRVDPKFVPNCLAAQRERENDRSHESQVSWLEIAQ